MISLGLSDFETNDDSQPPPDLLRALGETVAWCTRHLLDSDRLRSQELDPNSFLSIPALGEQEIRAYIKEKRDSYRRAMESINRKRSEILHRATIQPVDLAEAQALGRFLLYEFMETVSDGSSEALSHGFFDMEDAPPWDTWFWLKGDTIFCWIPDSHVSNAQAGSDANPVDCIHWAEWSALSRLINW